MQLKIMTLAAIGAAWALGAMGAGVPLKDTFAVCQLAGNEREAACTLPAGMTREYPHPQGVFSLKAFLPATATGEWTLLEGVKAHPLDDRLTAEVTVPGRQSPLRLPLDAWHRLTFARGRVYLAEHDLGPFPADKPIRLGGGAEFHCTDGKSVPLKSDAEIDQFIRGIPSAFRTWTLPAEQRKIVKGRHVKFAHGLSPTNTIPYTLVADVKFPRASWNVWRSLYTVDPKLDGAAFLNPQNRFGINGQYIDTKVVPDSIHRIAVAYNGHSTAALYWDGQLAVMANNNKTGFHDQWLYLGGDENGEDGEIEIMQVMLFDQTLDANTAKKLGGCK